MHPQVRGAVRFTLLNREEELREALVTLSQRLCEEQALPYKVRGVGA